MMKKIGILLVVLFLAGSVFGFQTHSSAKPAHLVSTENSIGTSVSSPNASVSDGWYFWHMMKMNREKTFSPTAPRGKYNFLTRTWS